MANPFDVLSPPARTPEARVADVDAARSADCPPTLPSLAPTPPPPRPPRVSANPFSDSFGADALPHASPHALSPAATRLFEADEGSPAVDAAPPTPRPPTPPPDEPPPPEPRVPAPIEVDAPTFAQDLLRGCAQLLSSGRHADLRLQLADGSLPAHRVVLEARCGLALVGALEADGSVMRGATVATATALLRFLYTEAFGGVERELALALLELLWRLEAAAGTPPPAALRRLRQLCEQELSRTVGAASVAACAHEAARIGAERLLGYCLEYARCHFDETVAAGGVRALQTALCAELFKLRSEAPLQDALAHGRADVAEHLLVDCDPATVATLLRSVDSRGRTPLEVALEMSGVESATFLIGKGADVDAMAGGRDEPLLHAVCATEAAVAGSEALRKAKLLLSHGASVDAMNSRGESALDAAIFRGTPAAVALLLEHKATSTMTTAAGGSLLHAAAEESRSDVLQMALDSLGSIHLDLNQVDSSGRTPLHVAVGTGECALVSQLLRARADTELIADDGTTPLRLAASRDDVAVAELLLRAGANKDAVGVDGVPLLLLASSRGVGVARLLVASGARVNQTDEEGRTALEVAVRAGEFALCEELLAKGAHATRRQDAETGDTVVHVAVMQRREALVRLLVRNKADLAVQNKEGCTPLLLASAIGHEPILEQLLQAGAALHLVDAHNRSALELALQAGHMGALKVLLQQSCVDVNGITKRGSSLLHFAAEIGDDARVDVVNPNGETPLHWACSLGHLNVVRCLVQHGADPLIHERVQGLTPLHAACSARGQPAVLALLIQRCEFMQWGSQPQKCNLLDHGRNTPLHTCIKLAPSAAKYVPILIEHGANPNLQNALGQTVLHLLAERAVRELQRRTAVSESAHADEAADDGATYLPANRILDNFSELTVALDATELETGNTALHIAAFGGCIELAQKLVGLGASVGLPNKDGFTPLDSMQPSGVEGQSLQELLLNRISKPSSWTPDRLVSACQNCKLPFNRTNPDMARKHHCRHCGRCTCTKCSPRRLAIPKFGTAQEERVCLLCERILTSAKN